jgi:hypothetical protein
MSDKTSFVCPVIVGTHVAASRRRPGHADAAIAHRGADLPRRGRYGDARLNFDLVRFASWSVFVNYTAKSVAALDSSAAPVGEAQSAFTTRS